METSFNKSRTASRSRQFDDFASVISSFGYSLPDQFGVGEWVATLESQFTPVMFRLEYEQEKNQLFLFTWVRTSSWDFDGERTDIHDIASIAFATAVTGGLDLPVSSVYMPGYLGQKEEMDTVFVICQHP